MYLSTYVPLYLYTYMLRYLYTYILMYLHIYIPIYVLYMYVYTHVHICTCICVVCARTRPCFVSSMLAASPPTFRPVVKPLMPAFPRRSSSGSFIFAKDDLGFSTSDYFRLQENAVNCSAFYTFATCLFLLSAALRPVGTLKGQ